MKTSTVHGFQFNVWAQSFCLAEPGVQGPVIYVGKEVNLMAAIKGVALTVQVAMECQHNTDVASLEVANPSGRRKHDEHI